MLANAACRAQHESPPVADANHLNQPVERQGAFASALLMTGSTYISYATGMLTSMLVARSLGPHDYGRFAYLVWASGVLVIACNNGLTNTSIRFVAELIGQGRISSARDVHGWLRTRQYWSLALVGVGFAAVLPWLQPAGWEQHLVLAGLIVFISAAAKATYLFGASVAKGYGQFSVEAVTTSVLALGNLTVAAVLWYLGAQAMAYLLLFLAFSIGHAVLTTVMMRRRNIVAAYHPLEPELKARLRSSYRWAVVLAMVGILSNRSLETYLLNAHVGAAEVGYFSIAAALARGGVDLLAAGLSSVLLPLMSHAFGAGGFDRAKLIFSDCARYFQFMGAMLAGVACMWAEPIVHILYGSAFEPVVAALRVMVITGGLTLSSAAYSALLSATDNQRLRVTFTIASVALSVGAALLLVPIFGFKGALASYAVGGVGQFVIIAVISRMLLSIHLPYAAIARQFVAAAMAVALSAPLMWMGDGLFPPLAAGALYAALLIAFSVVLKNWTASDRLALKRVVEGIGLLRRVVHRFSSPPEE
jgi:O-antigen/teichoic acid export membrane protein